MSNLSLYDSIAVIWFFTLWIGYNRLSEDTNSSRINLFSIMAKQRRAWMLEMLLRENRIVDIQILQMLGRSASFFASTTILVLAGLITVFGATDKSIELIKELPFAVTVSRESWELKVLTLILVFVYAFFKFGWAIRVLNYGSIMVGTIGSTNRLSDADRRRANKTAQVITIAASHTNRGIRAYYFGLALLSWHIHPFALIIATLLVVLVLYRREFHSRTLKFIAKD